MSHLVYPNATHTRFAHSVGVLKVMQRILGHVKVKKRDEEDLRLAALMHDIGHYPYSHLLEGVDRVILTEEHLDSGAPKSALGERQPYPEHEEVGQAILRSQPDLQTVLGKTRAERVSNLFTRSEVADQELSKLIHSSLDMDRIDYLIRDSQATGVPYGLVDIHYLLNHIKRSPSGVVGITHKAVAAAEHLLLARSYLFRIVYQHKTTFGFEEVARQLLRRLRSRAQDGGEGYGVPGDRAEILRIVQSNDLLTFNDALLDRIFLRAASEEEKDPLINLLATCIVSRRPPRLLWEKRTFNKRGGDGNQWNLFVKNCQLHLKKLAGSKNLQIGQFLMCDLKAIGFESRGPEMSKGEARKVLEAGEREEMIRVFSTPEAEEPMDIVELEHSLLHEISSHVFRTYRLYVVCLDDNQDAIVDDLKAEVKKWG